jgi:hypothetical protein
MNFQTQAKGSMHLPVELAVPEDAVFMAISELTKHRGKLEPFFRP